MSRQHRVRVGRRIQSKLLRVQDGLTELGVHIQFEQRKPKLKAAGNIDQVFSHVRDIWLIYSLGKEAIGNWPNIRKLLNSAGLKREEIITLGLSNMTKSAKKSVKVKKPKKS